MPDIKNLEALVIVLLAIVPGYTAIALYRRTKTYERPGTDLRTAGTPDSEVPATTTTGGQ